jgi:hypothetical protein
MSNQILTPINFNPILISTPNSLVKLPEANQEINSKKIPVS